MVKFNLSNYQENTLNRIVPKIIIEDRKISNVIDIIEISKKIERLLPKIILKKLNALELDCELIDLIEINEKINGEQHE